MTVAESYIWCESVARREAKNFYYSFLMLPREQRLGMCAIYAFMRYCDDLSDGDAEGTEKIVDRAAAIARWRADLDLALAGQRGNHEVWPAFCDTVTRYKIPHQYFFDMMAGVSSDLEPRRMQTFDELYGYCYRVASVVGLVIIYIFGFDDPQAPLLAEKCGIAFQLTNIIRDVKEDREKDRVYLPAEDFLRFQVSPETFEPRDRFCEMLAFEATRARSYYEQAMPLIAMVHERSRPSLRALIGIYTRLLDRIIASNYDVLSRRIRLSTAEKLWVLLRSWL